MEPSAKVLLDSISPTGDRLTTMEVTFHRIVLAEVNTHRALSRGSESSRAVPIEKKLAHFIDNPAWPIEWLSDQPGMRAGIPLEGEDLEDAKATFLRMRDYIAKEITEYLERRPERRQHLSKGWLNRPMEWLQWHTAIITATEWQNMFNQRATSRTPGAQLEFGMPAQLMLEALEASTPTPLGFNEWHTPLILPDEKGQWPLYEELAISAARCARISYLNQHGHRDPPKDIELFIDLINGDPRHYAPMENVATPCVLEPVYGSYKHCTTGWLHRGNFDGWDQLRHKYDLVAGYIH